MPESGFHGAVVAVGRPGVVDGACGGFECVADGVVGVGAEEVVELVERHGVGDVFGGAGRGVSGGGDDVEVRVDSVEGSGELAASEGGGVALADGGGVGKVVVERFVSDEVFVGCCEVG